MKDLETLTTHLKDLSHDARGLLTCALEETALQRVEHLEAVMQCATAPIAGQAEALSAKPRRPDPAVADWMQKHIDPRVLDRINKQRMTRPLGYSSGGQPGDNIPLALFLYLASLWWDATGQRPGRSISRHKHEPVATPFHKFIHSCLIPTGLLKLKKDPNYSSGVDALVRRGLRWLDAYRQIGRP